MQIQCPNCGTKVSAENINIQEKIAVCPNCDTVFQFELGEAKAKRRKLKQPKDLILRDEETLNMQFRTNFRLDRDESFVSGGLLALLSIIMGIVLLNASSDNIPAFLSPLFGLGTIYSTYIMALVAYNHTELEMDDEVIRVSRKPIPSLRSKPQEIQLSGIESFYAEETPRSIKESFDTQRYHVWAKYIDGSRRIVLQDLVEDYAFFIAQVLESRLHDAEAYDVTRLEDGELLEGELELGNEAQAKKSR